MVNAKTVIKIVSVFALGVLVGIALNRIILSQPPYKLNIDGVDREVLTYSIDVSTSERPLACSIIIEPSANLNFGIGSNTKLFTPAGKRRWGVYSLYNTAEFIIENPEKGSWTLIIQPVKRKASEIAGDINFKGLITCNHPVSRRYLGFVSGVWVGTLYISPEGFIGVILGIFSVMVGLVGILLKRK